MLWRKEGGCQNWARVGGAGKKRKAQMERGRIASRRKERTYSGDMLHSGKQERENARHAVMVVPVSTAPTSGSPHGGCGGDQVHGSA